MKDHSCYTGSVCLFYFTVPTTDNYEFLSFWPSKYFQFFYVDLLSGFWGFGVFLVYILKQNIYIYAFVLYICIWLKK